MTDTPEQRREAARAYLSVVHRHTPEEAFLGLSQRDLSGAWTHTFSSPAQAERLADLVADHPDRHSFFRVTALTRPPERGRGGADVTLGTSVLRADLDTGPSKEAALQALRNYSLRPALIVDSGNGLHAYWLLQEFVQDAEAVELRNRKLAEIFRPYGADDISDSARIMRAPGSYNLKRDPLPVTIVQREEVQCYLDDFEAADPVSHKPNFSYEESTLPDNWLGRLRDLDPRLTQRIETGVGGPTKADGRGIDRSKNDYFIAYSLLERGFPPEDVLAVLLHPTWFSGSKARDQGPDYAFHTVETALSAYQRRPQAVTYFDRGRFVPSELGRELRDQHDYLSIEKTIWHYEGGVYVSRGNSHVQQQVYRVLNGQWSTRRVTEVETWIQQNTRVEPSDVNNYPGLVNVRNGMLDYTTGRLLPHDPGYRSTIQLPASYRPDAVSPAVDGFLSTTMPDEPTIDLFWEYVSSCLITYQYWPKAFLLLVGPKDTGKSKLLGFLNALLGYANVSMVSMQDLTSNNFSQAELFGKLANIYADLEDADAQTMGKIKALTGDDWISADKKYQARLSFRNTARLIFSANHFPAVRGPDEAYFERVLIIPFARVFAPWEQDPDLLAKLTTPEALSAALNRMLEGLQRLQARGKLQETEAVARARAEYRESVDAVAAFFENFTIPDENAKYTKAELYEHFTEACKKMGRMPLSDQKFYRRTKELAAAYGVQEGKFSMMGRQQNGYRGRRIADEFDSVIGLTA